jgi:hypothetical protein
MKTYKLVSSQVAIPVIVEYQDEEFHDIRSAVGYVNYGKDQVWFPNNPELQTDMMRRAVLATLDVAYPKEVELPQHILRRVEEIKAGEYGHTIPNYDRSE